ncbi:uncharacterized protein LACBIDRAFT_322391 [Laccaria bicolor S238N-H82]|uniref:Predicted protein n=1 Tax=Laccaria bicolor (strain S238N-H82 / ATCC MYA-4686) TaxID=486041 RepID=B0CW47_LACBS|nr:uncharacterized protein LACBIDRAFT_322391 [Laccaria bicolor S238N-H82]EDR13447.1 predicted protein [Laccaria bicolor S238N-H82]|eukprot:XP_001875945.1 predicted protein [Laccaria bicolor S238N-H82]
MYKTSQGSIATRNLTELYQQVIDFSGIFQQTHQAWGRTVACLFQIEKDYTVACLVSTVACLVSEDCGLSCFRGLWPALFQGTYHKMINLQSISSSMLVGFQHPMGHFYDIFVFPFFRIFFTFPFQSFFLLEKYKERCRAIQILIILFLCKMSNFVDTSSITVIPLTSL